MAAVVQVDESVLFAQLEVDAADRVPARLAVWTWRCVAVSLALAALVAWLAGQPEPDPYQRVSEEYYAAIAGGLLALAGIVPAVLGLLAAGRPVTRLGAGQVLLRGWPKLAACAYGGTLLIGLVVALLSLSGGVGGAWVVFTAFAMTLLVTLGTPLLLAGAVARLQSRTSTLLAVAWALDRLPPTSVAWMALAVERGVERPLGHLRPRRVARWTMGRATAGLRRLHGTAAATSPERHRREVVKDLRDIAASEFGSGDRRGVRDRLSGLGTLAALTDDDVLAKAALDELAMVTRLVVQDRDLAIHGLRCLLHAADQFHDRPERLTQVAEEVVDVWQGAAAAGASRAVQDAAVDGLVALFPAPSDVLLQYIAGAVEAARHAPSQDLGYALSRFSSFTMAIGVKKASGSPVWRQYVTDLGKRGIPLLLEALISRVSHPARAQTDATEALADALADAVLTGNATDTLRKFRTKAQADRVGAALLFTAHRALTEGRDPEGHLLSQVFLRFETMPPEQRAWVPEVLRLVNKDLPQAVPRVQHSLSNLFDRLLTPSEPGGSVLETDALLAEHVADVLVELVKTGDRAAEHLSLLLAELEAETGSLRLHAEAVDRLRSRLAAQLQRIAVHDAERALALTPPLLPLLLTGDTPYALSWLGWLERGAVDIDPGRLERDALRLVDLAREALRHPAGDLVAVRADDALHGVTQGEAAACALRCVHDVLVHHGTSAVRRLALPVRSGCVQPGDVLVVLDAAFEGKDTTPEVELLALELLLRSRDLYPWTAGKTHAEGVDDRVWSACSSWLDSHARSQAATSSAASQLPCSAIAAWLVGVAQGRDANVCHPDAVRRLVEQDRGVQDVARQALTWAVTGVHVLSVDVISALAVGLASAPAGKQGGAALKAALLLAPTAYADAVKRVQARLADERTDAARYVVEMLDAFRKESVLRRLADDACRPASVELFASVLELAHVRPDDAGLARAADRLQRLLAEPRLSSVLADVRLLVGPAVAARRTAGTGSVPRQRRAATPKRPRAATRPGEDAESHADPTRPAV